MTILRASPLAALAVLLLAGSSGGAAQEQPEVLPTRDVDITYKVTRPNGPPVVQRARWLASEHLERVDGAQSSTLFDRNKNEVTVLNPVNRTYRKLEGVPRQPMDPKKGGALTRGDDVTIAGLKCTNWSWTEETEEHTVCLTPDGVMLRLVVDGETMMQAQSVTYHREPADIFEIPSKYSPALAPEGGAD
jgi:hypothetical protein